MERWRSPGLQYMKLVSQRIYLPSMVWRSCEASIQDRRRDNEEGADRSGQERSGESDVVSCGIQDVVINIIINNSRSPWPFKVVHRVPNQ
jgi:hypothetical protein